MREIKFRRQDRDGKWHFGDLHHYWDGAVGIVEVENKYGFVVQPITVGQFTGVYDINGKEIYEGDVLKIDGYPKSALFIIEYVGTAFTAKCTNQNYINYPLGHFTGDYKIEVIGNVHDNPELGNILRGCEVD